ncbi:hypothetical protein N8289_01220 [Flavobacteriales bacterium]|nr:hypothetical protein [Flavobacteriales bacterium]
MTKIILSAVMVFTMTIANAQSKKEQIENLTFSLDSLNQLVAGERQNFNTTLDSLNQLLSKNQQDFELEMDKSSITIKNLNSQLIRLNSINDSINQELNLNLSNANYIMDSLSNGITRRQIRIDSISLALDSIILVAQTEFENFDLKGTWTIISSKSAGISAMTDKAANQWLGKKATFKSFLEFEFHLIESYKELFKNSKKLDYKANQSREIVNSSDYFYEMWRTNIKSLEIPNKKILIIETECFETPFSEIIVISRDEIMIRWDGEFFIMNRNN